MQPSVKVIMLASCVLWIVFPNITSAHGPLDEQIAAATQEIKENPGDASLYLKRGELHRYHEDWQAALADLDTAEILDPELTAVDLVRGLVMFEAGWFEQALQPLGRFLSKHPNHAEALVARARTLVKLGRNLQAAEDYSRALKYAERPTPEPYLERAQALAAAGSEHIDEALRGLQAGMEKLGAIVTLQLYAIDLELQRQNYQAALARLDAIAAQSPRKEKWLLRRGQILQQAGKFRQAREAYERALKQIASLPQRRRQTKYIVQLENRLLTELEQVSAISDN